MKLWKKTTIMLIAFAAVALLAVVAAYAPTSGKGPEIVLPPAAKDAITKIELTNIPSPFSIEKSGSGWTLNPGGYKVNEKKVDPALDLLSKLTVGSMVSKNTAQYPT